MLDPFFGTGTTGAMAKKLQRHYIGIELEPNYIRVAYKRLESAMQLEFNAPIFLTPDPRRRQRVPFGTLVEQGFIKPGDALFFGADGEQKATVQADGSVVLNGHRGSIHAVARALRKGPANGWRIWHFWDPETNSRQPIDTLRDRYLAQIVEL